MKITSQVSKKLSKKLTKSADFAWILPTEKENGVIRDSGEKTIKVAFGKAEADHRKLALLSRKMISLAKVNKVTVLALNLGDLIERTKEKDLYLVVHHLIENAVLADFEFTKYKSKKTKKDIKELILIHKDISIVKSSALHAKLICDEVNKCRVLANTPGGDMTPSLLADEAEKALAGTSVEVSVLDRRDMEHLGMGGILGVAKGSSEEPKLIVMEYMEGEKYERPIVLVGKGVTFDTGGLSLKPSSFMNDMHLDMSGGAAVIHTMALIAKLKFKKNVVGLVPAVENMPSGSSYRPGDILRTMSGKTIEVLNTDAEGRIILADGISYAKKWKPRIVIDVATLTGAALVALGQRASAIFTKNKEIREKLVELGESTGDYVWPMPLWDEYEKEVQGTFGDWANMGKTSYGGAITAAIFLYQFAKEYPEWVHIDIAPRMTSTDDEFLAKGAVGAPVRLLTRFVNGY